MKGHTVKATPTGTTGTPKPVAELLKQNQAAAYVDELRTEGKTLPRPRRATAHEPI